MLGGARMGALNQQGQWWGMVAQIKAEITGIPNHDTFWKSNGYTIDPKALIIRALKIGLTPETITGFLLNVFFLPDLLVNNWQRMALNTRVEQNKK